MENCNKRAVASIRSRAGEIAASNEWPQTSADADLLAGLCDGTLSFNDIDDGLLERWIQAFGADTVIKALLVGAGLDHEGNRELLSTELKGDAMTPEDTKRPIPNRVSSEVTLWWRRRPIWIAALATIVLAGAITFLTFMRSRGPSNDQSAELKLVLHWPVKAPFNASAPKAWFQSQVPLPKEMPDFGKSLSTLGVGGDDQRTRWRLATAIVQSGDGWGSGAFISADGWLLTNYHVIASVAQKAASAGNVGTLEVITAHMIDGKLKPRPALKATLYRADPTLDLALLKLDVLPADLKEMPCFKLGTQVQDGEDCFVIGSQNNGPAWWLRSGTVSQQFDFPEDLSQGAAGKSSSGGAIDRSRATVIVTDTRISPGDSGGPLLNAKGELIGLTFATPSNLSAGSVGWHVALKHLRSFVAALPAQAEGVPFDPWTAGVPEADMFEPLLIDIDHDGRIDYLLYRYGFYLKGGQDPASVQPAAFTLFVDFSQRRTAASEQLDRVPVGLWGMEGLGRFQFDLFLTLREDGYTAFGYAGSKGIVDEIRIGQASRDLVTVLWRRDANGNWHFSKPAMPMPLVDSSRLGINNMRRLQLIVADFLAASSQQRPTDKSIPGKR